MNNLIRTLSLALVAAVVSASAALAQGAVLQAGPSAAGHAPMYNRAANGGQTIVQDSGPAGGGAVGLGLSELLQVNRSATASSGTGPLGSHDCRYSAPVTSASYYFLCFDANAQGGGLLAYGAGGSAPVLPFQMIINGTTFSFPGAGSGNVTGPSTSTVDDIATYNSTDGTRIKDSGVSLASQPANRVLATPSSGAGLPSFRTLVPADLPSAINIPSLKTYNASGSAQTTTGTIAAGSSTLTLASALDFANGEGVLCIHCGAAPTIGAPAIASVTAANRTGATSYAYVIAGVDYNGGVTAATVSTTIANGYATLGFRQSDNIQPAAVDVIWTLGTGTPLCTAVWRSKSGSAYELLGCFTGTYIQDQGISTVAVPWIPATPPAVALADWLSTTISSGAGSTTLSLAAAATTQATATLVMHDDTAAFNTAIANSSVFVPCGTYNIRQPLINSNMKSLTGAGVGCSIIKVLSPETSFGLNAGLVVISPSLPFTLGGLSVYAVPSMAFDGLALFQGKLANICGNEFKGATGIRLVLTDKTTTCNNHISEWWNIGIKADSSFGSIIAGNHVLPITGETVQDVKTGSAYPYNASIVAVGTQGETLITGNNVNQKGGLFGINCVGQQCQIIGNNIQYTGRECITIGGTSFKASDNDCFWAVANQGKLSSYDFAISTADDGATNITSGDISGNALSNSLFSPVAVFGSGGAALLKGISVRSNATFGAIQASSVHLCGIEISGSNSEHVDVSNNSFLTETGNMTYNVCEINQGGTGAPNNNIVGIQTGLVGSSGTVRLLGAGSYWLTEPVKVVCAVPPCTY